jgi:hypothetical protein
MAESRLGGQRFRQRLTILGGIEDILDLPLAHIPEIGGACTRRLQAFGSDTLFQP